MYILRKKPRARVAGNRTTLIRIQSEQIRAIPKCFESPLMEIG